MKSSNRKKKNVVHKKDIQPSKRYDDVFEVHQPDGVAFWKDSIDQSYIFQSQNNVALKIQFLSPKILQIKYAHDGQFTPHHSYSRVSFQNIKTEIKIIELDDKIVLNTTNLSLQVSKSNLQLEILDSEQHLLLKESLPFYGYSTINNGLTEIKCTFQCPKKSKYFGLGDKANSLDLRGHRFENWNTDSFAFNKDTDPLYRSIPFFYTLTEDQIAYGIFLDNTFRSFFDFDSNSDTHMQIGAYGGQINYYFIHGPSLNQVSTRYMELTGKPELPPLWSLGFHQCRWSYSPQERVYEVAKTFRELQIPCDAIYLDIDYMDNYKCFTWDKSLFPQPTQMISDLKDMGFHTVVMIDPGLKVEQGYPVYESGLKINAFCRRTIGDLMQGPVWPPTCVFPDYTDPNIRNWWGNLYNEMYNSQGVSGFWNDMNEPAVFHVNQGTFPDEVSHHYEGYPTNHRQAHNIYGMQMARATHDGLKTLNPNKRPFLLSRATFSGGQRYAAIWTGDNIASWEHLKIAHRQCLRLSVSGFAFVGTDIGGFVDQPSGELMVRWLQLGIFHPFFRIHSVGNHLDGSSTVDKTQVKELENTKRKDQEPWSFEDNFVEINKKAIELRYKLLPFFYTAFKKHIKKGTPIFANLAFWDQKDPYAVENEHGIIYDNQLLIFPILDKGAKSLSVYLPHGNWIDYHTSLSYQGKSRQILDVHLSHIPIFVNEGSLIAHYPIMQYTNQKPIEVLNLKLYLSSFINDFQKESELYEDDGDNYTYLDNNFKERTFIVKSRNGIIEIYQNQIGKKILSYSNIKFDIIGQNLIGTKVEIQINGQVQSTNINHNDTFLCPQNFDKIVFHYTQS